MADNEGVRGDAASSESISPKISSRLLPLSPMMLLVVEDLMMLMVIKDWKGTKILLLCAQRDVTGMVEGNDVSMLIEDRGVCK